MTIRIISLDFDGCLFNQAFLDSPEKDVIASNQAFLEKIKHENATYDQVITMLGSNRQSLQADHGNAEWGKGSCFKRLKSISEHLGSDLDPFLLADLYGNLADGEAYRAVLKEITSDHQYKASDYQEIYDMKARHQDWEFDKSKVSILYAQMHKQALAYPDEKIIYDFYDDRGLHARGRDSDILEWLTEFYTQFPEMIPANVTLRLHHYAGDKISDIKEIQGVGSTDKNYRQTIKYMAQLCVENKEIGQFHVNQHVTPQLLQEKYQQHVAPLSNMLTILSEKAKNLRSRGHIAAADTADTLVESLHTNMNQYTTGIYDKNDFKLASQAALNLAKPILSKHRNVKHILGNIGLFFATLVVGFLVAATINKVKTGNFLFFKQTDSTKKVEGVNRYFQEMDSSTPKSTVS